MSPSATRTLSASYTDWREIAPISVRTASATASAAMCGCEVTTRSTASRCAVTWMPLCRRSSAGSVFTGTCLIRFWSDSRIRSLKEQEPLGTGERACRGWRVRYRVGALVDDGGGRHHGIRRCRRPRRRTEREDVLLELGMEEVGTELVLLHLPERLLRRPAVIGHPIGSGHHARAMLAADTVHVDWSAVRVIDDGEELLQLGGRWRTVRRHRDLDVLHSSPLDQLAFVGLRIVAGQVDHRLDSQRRQVGVVAALRLGTSIVGRADAPEVIDPNARCRDASNRRLVRLGRS